MASSLLKALCSLGGAFGLLILLATAAFFGAGVFSELAPGAQALKLVGTFVRAACLFGCTWAAWRAVRLAAPFAWGAFAAFVVSGAADQVYDHGFTDGFGNLIPTYYYTSAMHALFAIAVWFLASRTIRVRG